MAKAQSFKNQPWTSLERGTYSLFEDDFLTDKLVFKLNKKGKTSSVAFKETITPGKQSKLTKISDQAKFWFPVEGRTYYAHLKPQSFKIHADFGVHEQNNYKFNIYGSVQGSKNLGQSFLWKAGVQTTKDELSTNLRLTYDPQNDGINLYNKLQYNKNSWKVGLLNVIHLSSHQWIKSGIQVSRAHNSHQFFFRTSSGTKYQKVNPCSLLNSIVLNYFYSLSNNAKLGLQVKPNFQDKKIGSAAFVWDCKCSGKQNSGVKVKADLNRNVNVSIKNNIEGYGSYIFGINVNELGGSNKFTYGAQLELNL